MCKKFRHLSLFSVCLHLLTCKRSCEKKINSYCRRCSRIRDFFDMDKFQDIVICSKPTHKDDFLFFNGKMIDLDVYLNRLVYFDYPNHPLQYKPCCYMEVLSHPQDLFAYFCSMFVRLYLNLNYAMEHFYKLISTIKLSDEKFVIEKMLTFAYELLHNFFDTNYLFFYEFYNVLDEVNLSDCYRGASNKPKFGPYIRPQITLEIITLYFLMFSSHLELVLLKMSVKKWLFNWKNILIKNFLNIMQNFILIEEIFTYI